MLRPIAPVRLGGELRTRVESFDRPDFGLSGSGYTSVMSRGLLQADVTLAQAARIHLQASYAQEAGRPGGPRTFDESRADLAQAYVDLSFGAAKIRLGRQELSVSGNRLLGLRDAVPLRRAFDGIKGEFHLEHAVATAFAVRQVLNRPGALDDRADAGDLFAGAALDLAPRDDGRLHLFLFHRRRTLATGSLDIRQTLGARYQRNEAQWDLASQFALQQGRAGGVPVRAWSGSVELGHRLAQRPIRVAIQLGAASGDRGRDRRIGTFDPLYPNLGVYSEAPIYYPANQINLGARIEGRWHGWTLMANTVVLARMSRDDAIYSAAGRPLVRDRHGGHVHGAMAELRAILPIGGQTELSASLVHGEPLGAVERAGGKAAAFGYVQLGRRF